MSAIFQVLKRYLDNYLYKKTLDENRYSLAPKIEILLLNKDNLALKSSKYRVCCFDYILKLLNFMKKNSIKVFNF